MSEWQSLGGVFTSQPHVVTWGEDQFKDTRWMVVAVGTDQAFWYKESLTVSDSPWASLGGIVMSPPHIVKSGDSSLDVFAVGVKSDLLHWRFENGTWVTVGESLGGILTSAPHAVMFGEENDELIVFALGTDRAVWFRRFSNGIWSPWDTLGRIFSSAPRAVTWRQENLAVFALGPDHAVWVWMDTGWTSLGGEFTSPPCAVATPNYIHVFTSDTKSALQYRRWDGTNWSDWRSFGGILMSPPEAIASTDVVDDVVQVYTVGTDSAIWYMSVVLDQPSIWQSLGGVFTLSPQGVTNLDNFIAVGLQADHAAGISIT
jgi:hypothetical protein